MKTDPKKAWNEISDDFIVDNIFPLPAGYNDKKCPRCGSKKLIGSTILTAGGMLAIEGTDESDPNILCQSCGYWSDAIE